MRWRDDGGNARLLTIFLVVQYNTGLYIFSPRRENERERGEGEEIEMAGAKRFAKGKEFSWQAQNAVCTALDAGHDSVLIDDGYASGLSCKPHQLSPSSPAAGRNDSRTGLQTNDSLARYALSLRPIIIAMLGSKAGCPALYYTCAVCIRCVTLPCYS